MDRLLTDLVKFGLALLVVHVVKRVAAQPQMPPPGTTIH